MLVACNAELAGSAPTNGDPTCPRIVEFAAPSPKVSASMLRIAARLIENAVVADRTLHRERMLAEGSVGDAIGGRTLRQVCPGGVGAYPTGARTPSLTYLRAQYPR